MKIGFIGLGSLGTPIALNLQQSGHQLYVYNRTAAKTVALTEKGAIAVESIAALARECNLVFSIVSDDAALKAIADGAAGWVAHAAAGSIHVSMSTVLPATAAAMEALHQPKGLHYLAAPVFGRPDAAAAKKLNFVISGQQNIREQVQPLLKDAGGAGVFDFGDAITAANTVKLCGNFLIASALEAIGESIALAKKSGLDPAALWNMLSQTLFNTPVYQNYSKIILSGQFEPAAFTAQLGLKDMKLVLDQAASVNQPMPLGALLKNNLETLVQNGKGQSDWSAVSLGGQQQ
ncbi:MAG TPA: NAD(P)-dependent oxidoreductase [Chitinophagaceae bacterium]|nr:NAD(P)-dependent oxidoreductase [Chitinophagaceae bacterium]